jgi:hypothetical protein
LRGWLELLLDNCLIVARLGAPDPRKDSHGGIDFRIQRQIKAYKKYDAPPKRVKPVPILIIIFISAQAFGDTYLDDEMAIADMITIAFFFILRPGEYTGTLSDDAAFKLQDVELYIQGCKLDLFAANDADIKSTTSVSYTFTTQKNGNRNEKLVHGLSGDPWCGPSKLLCAASSSIDITRTPWQHQLRLSTVTTDAPSLTRGMSRKSCATRCVSTSIAPASNLWKSVRDPCALAGLWPSYMTRFISATSG